MKLLIPALSILLLFSCSNIKPIYPEKSSDKKIEQEENKDVEFSVNAKKFKLDNGLTLIVIENGNLPIATVYSFYKVGPIYETPGFYGTSHFLEHMMFKESKGLKAGKFKEIIERNGGHTNAYTSSDMTVYYESIPTDILDQMLFAESDRMVNLILGEESFERERNVIIEERKMRYENSPLGQLYKNMFEEFYKGTPYENSPIGTKKDIDELTRSQMIEFYKTFYSPNNLTLVISGNVKADETYEKVKKYFGKIPRSEKSEEFKNSLKLDFSFSPIKRKYFNYKGQSPDPIVIMAWRGLKIGEKRNYSLDLLSAVLSYGKSSYLNQKFVLGKRPLATSISFGNSNRLYSGMIYAYAQLLKGISPKRFEKNFMRTLKKACKESLTPRNLQKAKNQFLISYIEQLESNSSLAEFIGSYEVNYGEIHKYKEELESYENVTLDEVKDECLKITKMPYQFFSVWQKN